MPALSLIRLVDHNLWCCLAGTTVVYAKITGTATLLLPLPAAGQVATGQIVEIAIPTPGNANSLTIGCQPTGMCSINQFGSINFSSSCTYPSTVRCVGYNDPTTSSNSAITSYSCARTCLPASSLI